MLLIPKIQRVAYRGFLHNKNNSYLKTRQPTIKIIKKKKKNKATTKKLLFLKQKTSKKPNIVC